MATLDSMIYTDSQFKAAFVEEATMGTKNVTTMQKLNITGDPTVTEGLTQDLSPRTGASGRVQPLADNYVKAGCGQVSTISFPVTLDTTVFPLLVAGAIDAAVGTSPAGYAMAYDYQPSEASHGVSSDRTYTVAWVSPETGATRIAVGCVITELSISAERLSDGMRFSGNVTFSTGYKLLDSEAAPSGLVAYGDTYRFLSELSAKVSVGGDDVALRSVEFTISNPATWAGWQGTDGNPQLMTRAIPKATITGTLDVKYDANTAALWESRRSGTAIAVELSDNATWASATFGFKGAYGVVTGDVNPTRSDEGMFMSLPLEFTASTSGDVFEIVP